MKLGLRIVITVVLLSSIGLLSAVAETATGTAHIDRPARQAVLSGVVQIRGSALIQNASPLNFQYYRLEYSRVDEASGSVSVAASSTSEAQVRGGLLGTWDTTQVPNGSYLVHLQVFSPRGVIAEQTVIVVVDNHGHWFNTFDQDAA